MNKIYLTAGFLALAALCSCSSEDSDAPVANRSKIMFRPEMATRATETTNANLSSIRVSAFLGSQSLFDGVDFTKDEADNYFKSTQDYFWPGDNSSLDFVAYAPARPGGTVTLTGTSKILADFSPAEKISDQIDFITSKASGNRADNEVNGVELVFDHRLTQIEVKARADNNLYEFKVTGIRIGQPVAKGSYDFDTNAWTLGADKAVYEETYTTPVVLSATPQNVMGAGGNAILIPQQLTPWDHEADASNSSKGAYISLKLEITAASGLQMYPFPSNPECIWAAIPISENWEAGKKYVYNLDLSTGAGYVDPENPLPGTRVLGEAIRFTVDVNDWATQNVN